MVRLLKKHYLTNITLIQNDSAITIFDKIIKIQEEIIKHLAICRIIDPTYNPNMIVFFPNNTHTKIPLDYNDNNLMEQVISSIKNTNGLHYNVDDYNVQLILRETFPLFLRAKKVRIFASIQKMHPTERAYFTKIISTYAPDLYEEFKIILDA